MAELTEFLLARIAEDETAARAAYDDLTFANDGGEVGTGWATNPGFEHNALSDPTSVFQRGWSPDRVLAECEAKRRIVAEHAHLMKLVTVPQVAGCDRCRVEGWCLTLRALALPYADHPDYDEGWKP